MTSDRGHEDTSWLILNPSNRFWGSAVSLAFLVAAVLLGNKSALRWDDPLTVTDLVVVDAGFCVSSVLSFLILVRPHVRVSMRVVVVRNPLKIYEAQASSVHEASINLGGFLRLDLGGLRVTAWGTQNVSLVVPPLAKAERSDGVALVRWAVLDGWLIGLLALWGCYAVSFLFQS